MKEVKILFTLSIFLRIIDAKIFSLLSFQSAAHLELKNKGYLFILGVTTLLHMRLGESLLHACEMPKVKPPMRFLPEPWTSLAYIPKSFRGNPFGTHLGCQVPDGELCMGPHVLWVQGARKALYQRVLPHDGPSNTVWSLPLLTSAWPGFAHTSLGRQTSRCRDGHQCAFLLIAVCSDLSSCLLLHL